MDTLQQTEIKQSLSTFPMEETSKYHTELAKKFENISPENVILSDHAKALIDFNGYYAMDIAKGAFFAVDTNMLMKKNATKPIYEVSFLISMDGTTSQRFSFTGTFNGTVLTQSNDAGLDLNLVFTRDDNGNGTTAGVAGNIALPNQSPVQVSGSTYNNPIKYDIYEGTYYNIIAADKKKGTSEKTVEALQLKSGYEILFDYHTNNGILQKVPSYTYNLNMYFFSFYREEQEEKKTYHLIMGTGGAKGLVAGNMTITTTKKGAATINSRQLLTVPHPNSEKPGFPNLKGADLANFSGYYTLSSVHPNAFLSIQAEYNNIDSLEVYAVMISYSLDGKISTGFYFDENSMSFENNRLEAIINSKDLDVTFNITFDRTYNPVNRALVSVSGTIITQKNSSNVDVQEIKGHTPFNPVPLTAFGGVTLTNAKEKDGKTKQLTLEIVNNNEIIYNGVTMKSFIYVPLMYILAYPIENPTLVMSFGPDGIKGNSCIITDYTTPKPTTSFVYAIHNKK